jgi:uncharacterized protein
MKNKKSLFVVFALLIFISCQPKRQANNGDFKPSCPDLPQLTGRINDYSDTLKHSQINKLISKLEKLENDLGPQMAVLIIDTLNGQKIEDYSLDVAECWRLGRETYNDGLLITLSLNDRQVRIEVGYGLERIIRDEIAKRIIMTDMIPQFRQDSLFKGIQIATDKIDSLIRSNQELIGQRL